MSLWFYPLLFVAGLVAGFVDSIAGGGGLITIPVLLGAGLPVPMVLGTNKLQASFGSVSAAWHYARKGVVDLRNCVSGIIATLAGALAGAFTVQILNPQLLERIIPWLLIAILLYTIFRPSVGEQDHPPRLSTGVFFGAFGLALGFYDGFFGPGVGSFWTISLVVVMGQNFTKATGYTKVMNATSNLAALGFFAVAGSVHLAAGLVMGAGQLIGARIGAGLVVKNGPRLVRPIFVTMLVLTLARMFYLATTRSP